MTDHNSGEGGARSDGDARAKLEKYLEELIAFDPSFADVDLDTPEGRFVLVLGQAMMNGASLTVETEDADGRKESVSVDSMGTDEDGERLYAVEIGSSDGTLSPETADFAAEVMRPSFEEEIRAITEQ